MNPGNRVTCVHAVAAGSVPSVRARCFSSASTDSFVKPLTRQNTCARPGDERITPPRTLTASERIDGHVHVRSSRVFGAQPRLEPWPSDVLDAPDALGDP